MSEPRPAEGDCLTIVNQGLALHQAGRLGEARQCYEQALVIDPRQFDALHMLGVIGVQTGQLEAAVALIEAAIAVRSDVATAHGNLANALNSLGRHEAALRHCDRALALAPDYAEAHGNRAAALHQLGRLEEALDSYQRQIGLRPADGRAWFNQAIMLRELGRPREALAGFDRAIALKPDHADAHRSRAIMLHDLGRFEEALASYERALLLRPDYPEACYDLGTTLLELRRPGEALASFDRAIALRPAYAEAHSNRGNALNALKRHAAALESFQRAIEIRPDFAVAYCNMMISLQHLERPDEALACCDRAIALKPDYAEAHHNRASALYGFRRLEEALAACDRSIACKPDFAEAYDSRGVTLSELGQLEGALASYDRALALKPAYGEAHHNRAMGLLTRGDYAEGWRAYEWRWRTRQFEDARRDLTAPLWLGAEDLRGRTILLHAEQGLGDTLQFCRYVPQVAGLGAWVVLEVQPGLERLLRRLEGVSQVVVRGDALPPYDFQTPLMSLPLALDAGPGGERGPYLSADPDQETAWRARLGPGDGLRVGLCWAGGVRPGQMIANAIDKRRSLALAAFAPLAEVPGLEFHSLQKGSPAAQLAQMLASGWDGPPIEDLTVALTDFADTAAYVANLDLVITCDTAVAHLAGALGKPVWILNRFDACWRWLDGRDDSPWYPSARLFRQPAPGDWASVIEAVKAALFSRTKTPA